MPPRRDILETMYRIPPRGLLATDLDGTLAVDGFISPAAIHAAQRLKKAGIPVWVITGRNLHSLSRVGGLWDVADEVLFSSGAGLLTSHDAAPLERARLSPDEVSAISTILDEGAEDYCILNRVPENHRFAWVRHREPEDNPDFHRRLALYAPWASPWDRRPMTGSQFLVIRPPGRPVVSGPIHEVFPAFALRPWSVFHGLSPLDHESIWMEIFPAGLDKGSALAERCAHYGIPADRVMALGNDGNDEAMLAWAGHPRAVSGSPAAAKGDYFVVPAAGSGGFEAAAKEALRLFRRDSSDSDEMN